MTPSPEQTDPPYVRIVAEIGQRIASGALRAGDRVPSTRQITQDWGVAMATATKVLTTLRQKGLVRAVPGVGTVVEAGQQRASTALSRNRPAPEAESGEYRVMRERIVRTAISIADAEGLSALSMRRIAGELGGATMSLYRYVSSKEQLMLRMADTVLADHPLPTPAPSGWRARLELSAQLQWWIYRQHPWLVQAISLTRPQALPYLLTHTEWALSAVDGLGLDHTTMLYVHITLFNYVRGTAVNLEWETRAEEDSGLTAEEWADSENPVLTNLARSGAYPTFSRVIDEEFDYDLDTLFWFGLRRLLDGLTVFLPSDEA